MKANGSIRARALGAVLFALGTMGISSARAEDAGETTMSTDSRTTTASAVHGPLRFPGWLRAERLRRVGFGISGVGVATFLIGGGIWAAMYEPPDCVEEEWCLSIDGPGLRFAAMAMFTAPVIVSGLITGGVGVARWNRAARLQMRVGVDATGARLAVGGTF